MPSGVPRTYPFPGYYNNAPLAGGARLKKGAKFSKAVMKWVRGHRRHSSKRGLVKGSAHAKQVMRAVRACKRK